MNDQSFNPNQSGFNSQAAAFMQLDLQNVPKHLTKLTFQHQHQCYKLVPDLSPDDDDDLNDEQKFDPKNLFQTKQSPYYQIRKRRQLPEIPTGKKPLEKIWKQELDKNCHLNKIHQTNSSPTISGAADKNLRWTRKLSTNMLLEIETDPDSGRALSLRLLNNDQTEEDHPKEKDSRKVPDRRVISSEMKQFMSDILCENSNSPLQSPSHQLQQHRSNNNVPVTMSSNNASDSGVSSNLQSPTMSTSDSIDYSTGSSSCDPMISSSSNSQKILLTPSSSKKKESGFRSLQLPEASHRALYRFCARHQDEIELEIGDPIYVYEESDDQWSDGVNLRTGRRGIFPSSLVTDVDYSDFTLPSGQSSHLQQQHKQLSSAELFPTDLADGLAPAVNLCRIKRERYLLDFMGSIEVSEPKGDQVLNEAIDRVSFGEKPTTIGGMQIPYKCVLEISDIGVRMMDDVQSSSSRRESRVSEPESTIKHHDYFFSLLQLTYCGYQFKNNRYYFAYITRHPSDRARYACHVFQATACTRDIAESVGRAFHRFYNRFVEITMPIETFYLDN